MKSKPAKALAAFGLILTVNGAVYPNIAAAFGPKDVATFDGPSFGPKDLPVVEGPQNAHMVGGNQR